jgi:hypothetical protein
MRLGIFLFALLANAVLPRQAYAHSPRAPEPRIPLTRSDDHFFATVYYSKNVISYDMNRGTELISTAPFFVRGLAYADGSLYASGDGKLAVEESGNWIPIAVEQPIQSIASDGNSLWAISEKELFEVRNKTIVRKVSIHGLKNLIFALFASQDGLFVSCIRIVDAHYGDAEGAGFFKLDPSSGVARKIRLPKDWRDDSAYAFLPTPQKGIYRVPFWKVWSVRGTLLFDALSESFTPTQSEYLAFDEVLSRSKNPARDQVAFYDFAKKLRALGLYLGQSAGLNPGEAGEFWELAYRVDFNDFRNSFLASLNDPFPPMLGTFWFHKDDDRLRKLILEAAKTKPLRAIQIPMLLGMRPGPETEEELAALFRDEKTDSQVRWYALKELKKVAATHAKSLCESVNLSPTASEWEKQTANRECGKR